MIQLTIGGIEMKNFKKVVLTFISVALVLVPSTLFAATVEVKNEEELFKAISSDNTIILQSDVTLTKALEIKGSNVTIDLNGNTLTVENGYIDLFEGKLEFTGKGIVKDIRVREKVTSTIWVEGSNDVNAKDFSTLVIGKDVTIDTTQWGITISNLDSNNKAYGVTVNFDGTLISSAVKGGGITVFGNVKNDGKIENAFSKENVEEIMQGVEGVVNDPEGTGYAAHRDDISVAAKTGTAELKATKEDTSGKEIGWFSVFTADKSVDKPILLISMVENVKGIGGSGYVVKKDATVLDEYFEE